MEEEVGRRAEVELVQVGVAVLEGGGRRRDVVVGAGAAGGVGGRARRGVGEMVHGDAGAITEREDVRLTEVRRAVVVALTQPVGAQLDSGTPGAPDDERGLVPVRIGSVPGLGAVVGQLDRHHAPCQVAGVLQAESDLGQGQLGLVGGGVRADVGEVLRARRNACHASEHPPASGGEGLPFDSAIPGLHAGADHLDILVLNCTLGEPLELGNTAGGGADRALSDTAFSIGGVAENYGTDRIISSINKCCGSLCNVDCIIVAFAIIGAHDDDMCPDRLRDEVICRCVVKAPVSKSVSYL